MRLRQAIHDFISNLKLNERERDNAIRQHTYLRDGLAMRLELDPRFNTFLTGSYARSTAIRPLKDIDVFCVMKRTEAFNPLIQTPTDALRAVKVALDTHYPGKAAEPQNRSVNIAFTESGIAYDIVPAFADEGRDDEVFFIPDIQASRWIRSNPRAHMARSVEANAAADSELKPLTKAVKHWNRRRPDGERLRSFHIEVMIWSALQAPPESRLDGLLSIFDGLALQVLHQTPDPARLGPDIDGDMTLAQKTAAADRFKGVASTLRDAKKQAEDGKTEAAHHLMYGLFGDPYPEKGKAAPSVTVGAPAIVHSAPDGQKSRFG
ncbi:MAG: nucleotidyltransferase [Polyangiaceae bacterium]|nr:nucleotidyltransferase [Polyangiaceae bacterium]